LYCDNKAVISIAHNPVQHDHCKRHVEIDKHFKKEISKKKTGKKKPSCIYTSHLHEKFLLPGHLLNTAI
jgi:hypothetical protein